MTIPDFPDWATPVAQIEQADPLIALGTVITANGASITISTAAYAALDVNCAFPPNAAAGARYVLKIEWRAGGITVGVEQFTFHSGQSYGGLFNQLTGRVPVRGTSAVITLLGSAVDTAQIVVTGSTRPALEVTTSFGLGDQQTLLNTPTSTAIAAATTSPVFFIPPVARAMRLWLGGSFATGFMQINMVSVFVGAPTNPVLLFLDRVAGNQIIDELHVPGIGLEVTVHNSDAAAKTFQFALLDVS